MHFKCYRLRPILANQMICTSPRVRQISPIYKRLVLHLDKGTLRGFLYFPDCGGERMEERDRIQSRQIE
jgi:hypothetical protein